MADLEMLGPVFATEFVVIPVIDVSAAMAGENMAIYNQIMAEMPGKLAEINEELLDAKALIAPILFNGRTWTTVKDPVNPQDFTWLKTEAGGSCDLGNVYDLLNQKLAFKNDGGWIEGTRNSSFIAPIILFVLAGEPTNEYQEQLKRLKNNEIYRRALRFGVALNDGAKDFLAQFTGNVEAVIDTNHLRYDFRSLIHALVCSQSRLVDFLPEEKEYHSTVVGFQCSDGENFTIEYSFSDNNAKEYRYYFARTSNGAYKFINTNGVNVNQIELEQYDALEPFFALYRKKAAEIITVFWQTYDTVLFMWKDLTTGEVKCNVLLKRIGYGLTSTEEGAIESVKREFIMNDTDDLF